MTNAVIESLMNHRTIRRFKDKPVEPEVVDAIVRAGIRTATAGNLQHYTLVVIDDDEMKRELGVAKAPLAIVALADCYRLKRWLTLNDAPFYMDKGVNLLIAYWDAVIALQNVVVAAESLGLGTLYIGGILAADAHGILDAPEHTFPAGLLCLGYPDESPELRPRLPLDAVVHRNGYHVPSDDEVRTWYRQVDAQWESLPEERKQKLAERGVTNTAQRVTLGHYTEEFLNEEDEGVIDNLARSKFKLKSGGDPSI